MKKSLFLLAAVVMTMAACNTNINSTSSNLSTNSSGTSTGSSVVSSSTSSNSTLSTSSSTSNSVASTSSSTSNNTSSSTVPVATYISQAALDSISGSMMLTGSYKIDAVRYGSDYDQVYENITIYGDDAYYCMETYNGTKVYEVNLFNDDDFASLRTLTEMNEVYEELVQDENGEYYLWEEFANSLSSLEVTDFELQEDGTYLCVDSDAATLLGLHVYGYENKMAKMSIIVKDDKIVKIDFATERYNYNGIIYQDSGSFVVSNHGTAEVPTVEPRATTLDHEVLTAALEEGLGLNYTAEVYAEVTPYGYNTSTGGYTYYFADDYVYIDNGSEEDSYGYYFDAGTVYTFGALDGESYFIDSMDGITGDLSLMAHDFSTFAAEMFTYQGEGVYTVDDEFAPVIGYLVDIDGLYGSYATKVTITLNDENKLESIKYDFYVDGYEGGYGFYQYTFKDVNSTVSPITLDGLFENIEIMRMIPDGMKGKWTVDLGGALKTVRISGKSVFIDTNQAALVSCDGTTLVVELEDETYSFTMTDNGESVSLSLNYNNTDYVVSKVDDSKWEYDTVTDFLGKNIIPAFTSGTDYYFGYAEAGDGSIILGIEISGADASTAWEDEYIIDLLIAGFVQDTSYAYEDGYGYIFVAPDSSCFVQFFYYAESGYNVFVIYVYPM